MSKTIEQILLKEQHIKKIIPAEKWEFPDIDYTKWKADVRDDVKSYVKSFREFLNLPYIVDDFVESDKRLKWTINFERRCDVKVREYYKRNALRASKMPGMDLLDMREYVDSGSYDGDNKESLRKAISLLQRCTGRVYKNYDDKTSEEKVEAIGEIKKRMYDVILEMSKG